MSATETENVDALYRIARKVSCILRIKRMQQSFNKFYFSVAFVLSYVAQRVKVIYTWSFLEQGNGW